MMTSKRVLETVDLRKTFAMDDFSVDILKGINFQANEGEFIAVMGPSGSGKSTFLYLVGGLDQASGGDIFLDGKNIAHLKDDELSAIRRREMGFIFQFYNLIPVLTVEENVLLPIELDRQNTTDYQERLHQLIDMVGLSGRKGYRPSQLSGGQQQRVAIARALINSPRIILADEPTGNLDSKTGQEVLQLLRRLCDMEKRTVIMVTHDPGAADYADRVVRIKDGLMEAD
jgi:putative ABC transport system ATP-binding protein